MACDFDPKAIRTAKRKNAVSNVEFRLADIRHQMPEGKFENIIWDAAIEHFTVEETATILSNIRDRLTSSGILSGHTIVERSTREKQLFVHHEFEFKSKEDLLRILSPYFKNVFVFETIYPERHNLYFYASDDSLPFSEEWTRACLKTNGNADFGVVRK
jgi:cyclopropane fatty-acyl-phospholipid synthase-like methyltransferase